MNKNANIVYIGNDLAEKRNYFTAMEKLARSLTKEGFAVKKFSSYDSLILRFLHMCYAVIRYSRWANYALIDTFSTKSFYYALFCSQLCRLFKLPYITILHGGNLPERIEKNKRLTNLIFLNSKFNVAPSNYLYNVFTDANIPVKLIPNSIDIDKMSYRERIKVSPRLIWVRSLANIYNPNMALEVVKKLKVNYPNIKLLMIGPDKENLSQDLNQLIHSYDLQNSIELTGALDREVWHKLSKDYDIFINTTNIDNTPVSLIEAMCLGLPIVSTNVGGIKYLIQNKYSGLLVERDNVDGMVSCIEELLKGMHGDISRNARKFAQKFDWSQIQEHWFNLLES